MRRILYGLLPALGLALLLPAVSRAAWLPKRAPAGAPEPPRPSYQDFLFLASTRPVLIRLHSQVDGRPYYAAWDDYMKKLFAQFDRDGNGSLSRAEAERAPQGNYLLNHLQGAIFGNAQTVTLPQMDTNKDGKVSLKEFRDYYSRNAFGPLRLSINDSTANATDSTDVIFKHLDADKDGKLTPAELTKAPTAFARLDMDEDETLSLEELIPQNFSQGFFFAPPRRGGGKKAEGPVLVQIQEGQPGQRFAGQILARYDKDHNSKLSRAESGLDKATFAALDRNKDGQLDGAELAGFFSRPPDLEFLGRIGKLSKKESLADLVVRGLGAALGDDRTQPQRLAVYNPKKRGMPLASVVKRTTSVSLAFEMGDTKVALNAGDRGPGSFNNIRQFYQRQFSTLDQKKKGYVDRKEAMTNQFVNEIFNFADRNGDGKLYQKELNAYFDLQTEGSQSPLMLTINDQGRSLFDLLDTNGDGRLSVRELREAWKALKPLSSDRKAFARASIPRRVQVALGSNVIPGGVPAGVVMYGGRRVQVRQPGPLWFRKMDRNNDGDLSPREFLGTEEEFKKLDADGDGLISADEARTAEARLAKKKP